MSKENIQQLGHSINDDTNAIVQETVNRDSSEKKSRSKFGKFLKAIFNKNTLHMMISHHPACEIYDSHVFRIGPLRLCKGCFLGYPPLYATLIIFFTWEAARNFYTTKGFLIDNVWWFVISFGILAIAGHFLLGKYSQFIKDLSKFGRGAWAGSLVVVILTQHWGFKIGAAVVLFGGMMFLSFYRGKDMEKTCQECEWNAQFDICPGWRDVTKEFVGITDTPESQEEFVTTTPQIDIKQLDNESEAIKEVETDHQDLK